MDIQKGLETYGLSREASQIYIILTKKLEASVSDIAEEVRIPRSTIYKILDSLERDGFVTHFRKNKVLHFSVTNASRFSAVLEEKQNAINSIVPNLNDLIYTASKKPEIKLFTGREGLKLMFEDIIKVYESGDLKESFTIAGHGANKWFPKYFKLWKSRAGKSKTQINMIFPEFFRKTRIERGAYITKYRFIPDEFSYEGTMVLFGDKIAIASFKEEKAHAVIIRSQEIADLFMQIWKFFWAAAKE